MRNEMTLEKFTQVVSSPDFGMFDEYPYATSAKCLGRNGEFDIDYFELYMDKMDYLDVFLSALKINDKEIIKMYMENTSFHMYENKDTIIAFFELVNKHKAVFTDEEIKQFLIKVLY